MLMDSTFSNQECVGKKQPNSALQKNSKLEVCKREIDAGSNYNNRIKMQDALLQVKSFTVGNAKAEGLVPFKVNGTNDWDPGLKKDFFFPLNVLLFFFF